MDKSINTKIEKLITEMTIEEKARFCSGFDEWFIEKLDRLGIPEVMMCDGPHGLRKRVKTEGDSYLYGDRKSILRSKNKQVLPPLENKLI